MKTTTKTIFLFAATATLISCGNETESTNETPEVPETPEPIVYAELDKATWLIGTWQMIMDDQTTTETWQRQNDSTLSGTSCTLIGADTVSYETLSLTQNGSDLFYIPTVSGQNNNEPVKFRLTGSTDELLIFENPEHDFPQKITYNRLADDSLFAEISGKIDGEVMEIGFSMNKVK
jgi:hypothetical protein